MRNFRVFDGPNDIVDRARVDCAEISGLRLLGDVDERCGDVGSNGFDQRCFGARGECIDVCETHGTRTGTEEVSI